MLAKTLAKEATNTLKFEGRAILQRVAVIGSAGFIGSFLTRFLGINGCEHVKGYDMRSDDRSQQCKSEDLTREELAEYDVIIYLAGLSGRVQCMDKPYEEVIKENVTDLLDFASRMSSSQTLIYACSGSALEGYYDKPCAETTVTFMTDRMDAYARSMAAREQALARLTDACYPTCIGVRFGTVIGLSPNMRLDLIHANMVKSAIKKGHVTVSKRNTHRAILHINELGNVIRELILRHGELPKNAIYNVASFNTTADEIAQAVSAQTGAEIKYADNDLSPNGFWMDTRKVAADLSVVFSSTNEKLIAILEKDMTRAKTMCRVCKNEDMRIISDLGYQPLANNYTDTPVQQRAFPLVLTRCSKCHHTQQDHTVPREEIFTNYSYNSGVSRTLKDYFTWLAQKITGETSGIQQGARKLRVLELACNDGTQLDEFAKLGWETYGVDPAANLVKIAGDNGHKVFCKFWGTQEIPKDELPSPDVIVAQNVCAHVPDPVAFLSACHEAMSEDSRLYIQNSQCNMYENGEFDTIYHEHLSFFTAASMEKAASMSGLTIVNACKTPIHGTSYLFTMKKTPLLTSAPLDHDQSLKVMMERERALGIYDDRFYVGYNRRIQNTCAWMHMQVAAHKADGYSIVAFGAAAKGMVLLNLFNMTSIEYIADDAIMKQGKFTPGLNIPIVSPDAMAYDNRKLAVVVLAWNFYDEIAGKVRKAREGTSSGDVVLIVPFPTQLVVKV